MKLRLRSKITLSLLAVSLIPLGLTTALLARLNYDQLVENASDYRKVIASHASVSVRELFHSALNEISTFGQIFSKRDMPSARREQFAQQWLQSTTLVRVISVYNPKGQHLLTLKANNYKGPARPDALSAAVRKKALQKPPLYQRVRFLPDRSPFLGMVQPVFLQVTDKKPYLYLWSGFALTSLTEQLSLLSMRQFERRPDQVFLVNQKMRLLTHSNRGLWGRRVGGAIPALGTSLRGKHAGVALSFDYTHRGEDFSASLVPLTQLGWAIVVRQSKSEAYSVVYRTLWWASGIGLVFILLSLGVGLWFGRQLSAPILAVSAAAQLVAEGDFSTRVQVSSRDEVGEMATSFNVMASELESYEQQLIEETKIRTDLGRYLNADLVEAIVARKSELTLGGERRQITVMFADVVAFTPLTEAHEPERVVAVLNELFTFLTEIVFKHGGIIDKFIGDCVMAVFGAPYAHDDDPLRAARAADEMMRWLDVGNARWQKELGVALQMGIGINTGEAVVGNIGSQKRMEYTVIGDTVNVAARLEALARPGQILVTKTMASLIEDEFDCVSLGEHQLTGRKEPLELFVMVD